MYTCLRAIIVFSILAVNFSCGGSSASSEIVYAATAVGTPSGETIKKDIGPAGGALSSPDGRLTLTVPPNALAETVKFSIQPITNNVQTGIGLAYRLGPDGKTFSTPLELSVRYEESDLEGTLAEALAIAFQDKDGKWRVLDPTRIDGTNRSITFLTRHFTDFSFLAKMRLEPSNATLRVGETMQIRLIGCGEPILGQFERSCNMGGRAIIMEWYADVGTVTSQMNPAIYTAPPRKPSPNIATVSFPYALADHDDDRVLPILPGEKVSVKRGMFTSKITIVDWGYRASGGAGGLTFSGVVCSLEQPFTIIGKSMLEYSINFTPSSPTTPTTGSFTYTASGLGITAKGNGSYTVEGMDTDRPKIIIPPSPATGTASGRTATATALPASIDLVPVEGNHCR